MFASQRSHPHVVKSLTVKQVYLALSALVLAFASSLNAQTVSSVDRLALVDARGNLISNSISVEQGSAAVSSGGTFTRISGFTARVNLIIGATAVQLETSSRDWQGSDLGQSPSGLVFESFDCTGQPYFPVRSFNSTFPPTIVAPPGQTVYVPMNQPPEHRALSSALQKVTFCFGEDPCPRFECVGALDGEVVPAQALIDLDTKFVPPFSVLARQSTGTAPACCGDCDGNGSVAINELVRAVGGALDGCP